MFRFRGCTKGNDGLRLDYEDNNLWSKFVASEVPFSFAVFFIGTFLKLSRQSPSSRNPYYGSEPRDWIDKGGLMHVDKRRVITRSKFLQPPSSFKTPIDSPTILKNLLYLS